MNYHTMINGIPVDAVYEEEDIRSIFLPLLQRLTDMQQEKASRLLVLLAAPPAAGKSTLSAFLQELSQKTPGITPMQSIGMDGFHHYQNYLVTHTLMRNGEVIPMVQVKGCPETFDLPKLTEAVKAVASGDRVPWPTYDRMLHDPTEDALRVTGSIVLLEGNYLLLDRPGWDALHAYADLTIRIDADPDLLRDRLIDRKAATGVTREQAERFVDFSDLYNAHICLQESQTADLILQLQNDGTFAVK